jgi:two-component system, chemotaxis family, CheB/CheR fusion protein
MANRPISVVGIGASAGGLEAFHAFFENMPADTGMAFVVILHLPMARKSLLPEILRRWTTMPVVEAANGTIIEANCVYVPPAHSIAKLANGAFVIEMPELELSNRREYLPIDVFFDSLATSLHEDAFAIILSGTGTDGSLGLKAVKECGGTTFAQGANGTGPMHPGMPEGAIATGAVDYVLAVAKIPNHILRLIRLRSPREETWPAFEQKLEEARLTICTILRARLGHDFSGYKDHTFMRRLQRRMQAVKAITLDDYVKRLADDQEEVSALFRELLIRVTSFFRDDETFALLEQEIIPRLFAGKNADGSVRVWVPGCATGEEAYSLAILLRKYMDKLPGPPKVQVFATDVDESAVAIARLGRYPSTLLAGLSPERLLRFFHASQTGYTIAKEVRELCTFSPHSIVRDPPLSRMNLISCRNVLIYLDQEQQAAIIPSFHYALAPGGVLLLGRSESVARHDRFFRPLDKASRIYLRRDEPDSDVALPRWETTTKPPLLRQSNYSRKRQSNRTSAPSIAEHTSHYETKSQVDAGSFESNAQGPLKKLRPAFHHVLRAAGPILGDYDALKKEPISARQQLQKLSEEHQNAVEELHSTNEELHSVNEELQSTNEELETSKEEIQSINEELQTVNARLSEKVDELDRYNSDLRNLFDSTQIATVFLDRHLIIRSFTPAVATIYNLIPSDQGRPLTDIVSKLRYNGLRNDVENVLQSLIPLERRVVHQDETAHYLMRILPYRAADSTVSGVLVTFLDVTSIVRAEQHQTLLVDELNHRVKNMLTIVVSLATQTLKRSTSLDAFAETFLGRLKALTSSYSLLASQNWLTVDLETLILEETGPFAAKDHAKIRARGPSVRLAPPSALAIGMALHELATNALKYGALSIPEGHVEINWRVQGAGLTKTLVLEWTESNGPPVESPSRLGFGTTLIERGIAHELSGETTLQFDKSGVRAILRAPIKTVVGQRS